MKYNNHIFVRPSCYGLATEARFPHLPSPSLACTHSAPSQAVRIKLQLHWFCGLFGVFFMDLCNATMDVWEQETRETFCCHVPITYACLCSCVSNSSVLKNISSHQGWRSVLCLSPIQSSHTCQTNKTVIIQVFYCVYALRYNQPVWMQSFSYFLCSFRLVTRTICLIIWNTG